MEPNQHPSAELLGAGSAGEVPRDAAPAIRQTVPHDLGALGGHVQAPAGVRAGAESGRGAEGGKSSEYRKVAHGRRLSGGVHNDSKTVAWL